MSKITLTVAICTWNRARLLDQTLSQFGQLQVPAEVDWELLVVNNRCTDNTDEVLERHRHKLPLRRLYQGTAGKSHAANLAVKEAGGDIILWTDDDVLVDPLWLKAYAEAAQANPDAVLFGGEIHPWFESTPPAWIQRHMGHLSNVFSQRILNLQKNVPIVPGFTPWGANMAMRKACLGATPFDVKLGPLGGVKFGGEETRLIEDLLKNGHKGVWVKDARVRHFIFSERLTQKYIWDWFRWCARTMVKLGLHPPPILTEYREDDDGITPVSPPQNPRLLFGALAWLVRRHVVHRLKSYWYAPFKCGRWLHHFTTAAACLGYIEEYREFYRRQA